MTTAHLSHFQPVTLDEMSGIRLMNRIDTKFVTTREQMVRLLVLARGDYYVQDILGERNMEYRTTYYDTDRYDMYRTHQAGHANRQKLRFRNYVSSNLQFMEVKTKNNHGRTKKKRIRVDAISLAGADRQEFLHTYLRYDSSHLMPTLSNSFRRITLVNRQKTERLTIDSDLRFHNMNSGTDRQLDDLVIIELKRDGLCPSPILPLLRELRIKPHGFSKYCMGMALTDGTLPINRFKQKLIEVGKLLNNVEFSAPSSSIKQQ